MDTEFLNKIYLALIKDPVKSSLLIVILIFLTVVGWYLSAYVKEKARSKASDIKNGKKKPNEPEASTEIPKNEEKHFPTVTFSDGNTAAVQVTFAYQIYDAKTYVYESADPIGILSNLVDARFRQFFEQFSIKEAIEKRREAERELKHDLSDEFVKYGIELESIIIGAIQPVN